MIKRNRVILLAIIFIIFVCVTGVSLRYNQIVNICSNIQKQKEFKIISDVSEVKKAVYMLSPENLYTIREYLSEDNLFKQSGFFEGKEFAEPELIKSFLKSSQKKLYKLYRVGEKHNGYYILMLNDDYYYYYLSGRLKDLDEKLKYLYSEESCMTMQIFSFDHLVFFIALIMLLLLIMHLSNSQKRIDKELSLQKKLNNLQHAKLIEIYNGFLGLALVNTSQNYIDSREFAGNLRNEFDKYLESAQIKLLINLGSSFELLQEYILIVKYLILIRVPALVHRKGVIEVEIRGNQILIKDDGFNSKEQLENIEGISNIIEFIENNGEKIEFIKERTFGLVQRITFNTKTNRGDNNVLSFK